MFRGVFRMRTISSVLAFAAALGAAMPADAALCSRWSAPRQVGTLDTRLIPEESGLAISRRFPNRYYHNNDSGDGPRIYITDPAGRRTQVVTINGFTPTDVEDVALGRCEGAESCLYVADIGDNASRRPTVSIVVLAEQATFPAAVTPLRTITARYPEGPQDAESLAIHPNGDLYVITKPRNLIERRAGVARVYRLTAAQLAVADGSPQTFELIGTIDFPYLLYFNGLAGQIATSMDFAPDGSRAMVVTYQSAVEINFDFSHGLTNSRAWRPNVDYRVTPLAALPQAESVAYTADGRSVVYGSERVDAQYVPMAPMPVDLHGASPLFRMDCQAR